VEKSPEAVIREAFVEALGRDPKRRRTLVALVDGNAHQIDLLKRTARKFGVQLQIILDVVHVIEYLWKAAHVFHGAGTPEAEAWVSERLLRILSGTAGYVARGMRHSATSQGIEPDRRKAIDECAAYLLNHTGYLHYDQYLAAGLPIATGVIEGACRHLVKDRMDITGARWSLNGAEAILRLRALRSSGDFAEYWQFHEFQEARRNHAALFALPITPHTQPSPGLEAGW
jgi:hypothetical protein